MLKDELFVDAGFDKWVSILDYERRSEIMENFYSDNFKDFYGNKLISYDFIESRGLCGILLPNGIFLKCGHSQHFLISDFLDSEESFLSIYFSSRLFKSDRSIFTHNFSNSDSESNLIRDSFITKNNIPREESYKKIFITKEQLEFLESHYCYLNDYQKLLLSSYMCNQYESLDLFKADLFDEKRYYIVSV